MGNEMKVTWGQYCMLTIDSACVSSNLAWGVWKWVVGEDRK